jgi:hypothetical protein
MSEKKIDLIAQLLAKAESTTPEEAEALTEHAERLMVKYAIDQAVIDARRAKEGKARESIVTRVIAFDGTYRDDLMHMGTYIVRALGSMRPLHSKGRQVSTNKMHPNGQPVTRLHIVGFESDVDQAEALIRSLQIQAMVALKAWWADERDARANHSNGDQQLARKQFIVGFGSGAGARITENRNQVISESGSGTELVLVDRASAVDDWIAGNMRVGQGRSGSRRWDSSAQNAGNRAGRSANTGERQMTQGRGLPAGR